MIVLTLAPMREIQNQGHSVLLIKTLIGDFPGGPVAKTLHAQHRRPGV